MKTKPRPLETPSPAALAAMRRVALGLVWRCGACGYQRSSIARPAACPGCHGPGEGFRGLSAVAWRHQGEGAEPV